MRNTWKRVLGVCLVVEDSGVQVDVEKDLACGKEMGDGVQVCGESCFEDGALDG